MAPPGRLPRALGASVVRQVRSVAGAIGGAPGHDRQIPAADAVECHGPYPGMAYRVPRILLIYVQGFKCVKPVPKKENLRKSPLALKHGLH